MKNNNKKILGILKYFFTSPKHIFTGQELAFLNVNQREWEFMTNIFPFFIAKDNTTLPSGKNVNYKLSRQLKKYIENQYLKLNKKHNRYSEFKDDVNSNNFWVISSIIFLFFLTQKKHEGYKDLEYACKIGYGFLDESFDLIPTEESISDRNRIFTIVEKFNMKLAPNSKVSSDKEFLKLCDLSKKIILNAILINTKAINGFEKFIFPHSRVTRLLDSLIVYNINFLENFLKPNMSFEELCDAKSLKNILDYWSKFTLSDLLSTRIFSGNTHYFIQLDDFKGFFAQFSELTKRDKVELYPIFFEYKSLFEKDKKINHCKLNLYITVPKINQTDSLQNLISCKDFETFLMNLPSESALIKAIFVTKEAKGVLRNDLILSAKDLTFSEKYLIQLNNLINLFEKLKFQDHLQSINFGKDFGYSKEQMKNCNSQLSISI